MLCSEGEREEHVCSMLTTTQIFPTSTQETPDLPREHPWAITEKLSERQALTEAIQITEFNNSGQEFHRHGKVRCKIPWPVF